MEAKIKKKLDIDVRLIEGSNGVFNILFNSESIFSKDKEGRFPADEEIINLLKIAMQSKS
ncbi:MAG: Rdx family protein [Candidatus Rariloculaceae bacterium]